MCSNLKTIIFLSFTFSYNDITKDNELHNSLSLILLLLSLWKFKKTQCPNVGYDVLLGNGK